MAPNFAARSNAAELMDGDQVTGVEFAACLADLAKVNTVTRARPPTLDWLGRATKSLKAGDRFSLVDVGYGQGDMLRAIKVWATKRGLDCALTGVDLNPRSAPAARAVTDPALGIDFRTGDVFAYAPASPPDFIISSLVTHHMSDEQIVRFLAWMEATSRRGWFVNDLHRHRAAYYGFMALSAVVGWHPFVRHDGPVSVARSFRRGDWERLLQAAKIPPGAAAIEWRMPFRYCVGRIR